MIPPRRPTLIPQHGRVLTCTRCQATVHVLEAAENARTDHDHHWITPAAYVCGSCLEHAGETGRLIDTQAKDAA